MSKFSWFGGPTVFWLNVCALAFGLVTALEAEYITYERFGHPVIDYLYACFLPALVMFVIRDTRCSYPFLALYVAVSIQLWFQIQEQVYGFKSATPWMDIFNLFSVAVLAVYLIVVLIRAIIRTFTAWWFR